MPPEMNQPAPIPVPSKPFPTKTVITAGFLIVGVVAALVAYVGYQSTSAMGRVNAIQEAGNKFYAEHRSFDGFCEHETLKKAEVAGIEVSCEETGDDVSISLTTADRKYMCRSARTPDTKRIACAELDIPEVSGKNMPADPVSSESDTSTELTTLTEEPAMCPKNSNILYTAGDIRYSVAPGSYSLVPANSPLASLAAVAINKDRTICSCSKREDGTVIDFDYGVVNGKGFIEWDWEKKSWPSKQERIDRYYEAYPEARENKFVDENDTTASLVNSKNSLVTMTNTVLDTARSFVIMIDLESDGCAESSHTLYPLSGVASQEICGCSGRGVN